MPQTTNRQGHDYEMPPHLIGCLVRGTTWALWCRQCPREVIVDVVGLLEHHELYDPVRLDRAVCKACGEGLRDAGGYVLRSLQFRQRIPRLITADGSSWPYPDLLRKASATKDRRAVFGIWEQASSASAPT
jgi:hypothetical protein